jgi:DNA repair protein RecO (recombination protein O)
MRATAFGAYKGKSKLAGSTEAFTEGTFFIYRNPVKEQIKISDIAPEKVHELLRRDLDRLYIASFWAELIIKTYGGGGEYGKLYRFFRRALGYLESVGPGELELLRLHFFWRYVEFLGMRPALEECAACGRGMEPEEPMYLAEGELLCAGCAPGRGERLDSESRSFLLAGSGVPFSRISALAPGDAALRRLLRFTYVFAEGLVGSSFNSLKRGVPE